MEKAFTDNDYRILKALLNRENKKVGLSKPYGTTVNEIASKTGLSTKKVRGTLKSFMECDFVAFGVKQKNAATYILTKKGFAELKSLRVNIFGKVED